MSVFIRVQRVWHHMIASQVRKDIKRSRPQGVERVCNSCTAWWRQRRVKVAILWKYVATENHLPD